MRLVAASAAIWVELVAALAGGCALNVCLAAIHHERQAAVLLGAAILQLCLPYMFTFRYGISAAALALVSVVGSWKAFDLLAGTRRDGVVDNGFTSLAMHFASPVEYQLSVVAPRRQEGHASRPRHAVKATPRLWLSYAAHAAGVYSALAVTASVHGYCEHAGIRAPALYAEVWGIFLFLHLLTDVFSTLVAVAGYAPEIMFRDPLLRSTSLSDFWGRRWNLLIHGLLKRTVFRPLTRRGVPAWGASVVVFAVSGLFHEYAFAPMQPDLRASTGRCLLFFLCQPLALAAERFLAARVPMPRPLRSDAARTLVWTALLLPLVPLFVRPLKASGLFGQVFRLVPRLAFGGS